MGKATYPDPPLSISIYTSAALVFVGSGMRLAWSIFDTPAGKFLNDYNTHNLMMSWFIGAAVGALLAALFVQRVTKNVAFVSAPAVISCLSHFHKLINVESHLPLAINCDNLSGSLLPAVNSGIYHRKHSPACESILITFLTQVPFKGVTNLQKFSVPS